MKFQSSPHKGEAEYPPQNNTLLRRQSKKSKTKTICQKENSVLGLIKNMRSTSNNSKESSQPRKKEWNGYYTQTSNQWKMWILILTQQWELSKLNLEEITLCMALDAWLDLILFWLWFITTIHMEETQLWRLNLFLLLSKREEAKGSKLSRSTCPSRRNRCTKRIILSTKDTSTTLQCFSWRVS